ncbi:ADP-ribosyltransferase [Streptomyces sp. NBC_01525]|uniref:ADP-ribosyltransferase n=1 Tax=Streptomyces sp. NBC_01525 TaxID=2903893 RepID=UPI003870AA0E
MLARRVLHLDGAVQVADFHYQQLLFHAMEAPPGRMIDAESFAEYVLEREEPFEYKQHVTDEQWDKLGPARRHDVANAEVSLGAVPLGTDEAAVKYGQAYWNLYAMNDMSQAERDAVRDYTGISKSWETAPKLDGWASYKEVNAYLRGDASKGTRYVQNNIEEIDKALAGRPVPQDVMVVRGTVLDHLTRLTPDGLLEMLGNTYEEKAYMSTSLGYRPIEEFQSSKAILRLRVLKGTPALWVEKVGNYGVRERELLLGRGMKFLVRRVFMENGQVQVYGEFLPSSE